MCSYRSHRYPQLHTQSLMKVIELVPSAYRSHSPTGLSTQIASTSFTQVKLLGCIDKSS